MTPPSYEIRFALSNVSRDQEDYIADDLDGFMAHHGGAVIASFIQEARGGKEAAYKVYGSLKERGIDVLHVDPDYVTRSEIAVRMGVTTQAVGQWVRGVRQTEERFPEPSIFSAGATLWLWADVVRWARDRKIEVDEEMEYLTMEDIHVVNGQIVSNRIIEPYWSKPSVSNTTVKLPMSSAKKTQVVKRQMVGVL